MIMGIKFNWEFNVGTLLTIASFIIGGIGIYVSINETLAKHEQRLLVVEKRTDPTNALVELDGRVKSIEAAKVADDKFRNDALEMLIRIREDLAGLKALQQQEDQRNGRQ